MKKELRGPDYSAEIAFCEALLVVFICVIVVFALIAVYGAFKAFGWWFVLASVAFLCLFFFFYKKNKKEDKDRIDRLNEQDQDTV